MCADGMVKQNKSFFFMLFALQPYSMNKYNILITLNRV